MTALLVPPGRTRLGVFLLAAALLIGACDEPPTGPSGPSGPDVTADDQPIDATHPYTEITSGPVNTGYWNPEVEFRWTGRPENERRWALVTVREYRDDHGGEDPAFDELIAWVDTLRYHVLPGGGYDPTDPVWTPTERSRVHLDGLPVSRPGDSYLFAVRGRNRKESETLVAVRNTRTFRVAWELPGPDIVLTCPGLGKWHSGDPPDTRELFAGQGLRFTGTATPGPSLAPVARLEYAEADTTIWEPFPPESNTALWFPAEGLHSFFVRAVDEAGFATVLEARLLVCGGPRFCNPASRYVLVVLDTDAGSLIASGILPPDYAVVERARTDTWFEGYRYEVFETHGTELPAVTDLDCASSTVWLHSAAPADGDDSALERYQRSAPHVLPGYVASGGNFFLCGIQPSQALRYFQPADGSPPILQPYPVDFAGTLPDSSLEPHWATTHLGISRVETSIGSTTAPEHASLRVSLARAAAPGGSLYPDLPFDPLSWPDGANQGGFGFYDRDLTAGPGAEMIYTIDDTGLAVGTRRLTAPGPNGNCVFLGLHPYFVLQGAFGDLVQAVLSEFGEVRSP